MNQQKLTPNDEPELYPEKVNINKLQRQKIMDIHKNDEYNKKFEFKIFPD